MRTANLNELAPMETIGALVDFADRTPREQVVSQLRQYLTQAIDLLPPGAEKLDAECVRHLVITGALMNRTLFDVLDLPQDRDFPIR